MSKSLLKLISAEVGGQVKFANEVNQAIDELWDSLGLSDEVRPASVYQAKISGWICNCEGPVPPAEYVLPIEMVARKYAVEVSRYDLRPDVYGFSECAA